VPDTLDHFVSEAFEDDDLQRVAERVRQGKADAGIVGFQEMWEEWAATWAPPSLQPGQLRPFAFNNWRGYDSEGLASTWMELVVNPAAASQIDEQIIRHLLFCDSIALPDPFFWTPEGDLILPRWSDRASLAVAIETVNRLSDLIQEGVIVLVPKQHFPAPEVSQVIGDSGADLFPPPPSDWWVLPPHRVVALDLAAQIGTADGGLDPYLPTNAHVEIFRQLCAAADAEIKALIGSTAPNPANAILPRVLDCRLPDAAGVTFDDVIAIRRQGYFADWRNALASGVDRFTRRVGDNPESWPNADKAMREEVAAEVQEKARQAQKEIGWTKNPRIDVGVNLVLVGGAASAAFLAPPVAAAIAGAAALPTLMGLWARYRFRRSGYARHVAIFERADPGRASPA
jgi:hypothetical protein